MTSASPQIGAGIQQMRRVAVTQGMRTHRPGDPRTAGKVLHDPAAPSAILMAARIIRLGEEPLDGMRLFQ